MSHVLIIEDDADIALSLRHALERTGEFEVTTATDGEEGLRLAHKRLPDLVLLDLNLPGMSGIEVCQRLRSDDRTSRVALIMLTARIGESEKISGLDAGADDYVTKPFSLKEVLARVRAVLRRSRSDDEEPSLTLRGNGIELDVAARTVTVKQREISLTRKEFDLLCALMRQAGRVLTRERLLERVWGYDHPGETRTVDVHVRQLRKKLGQEAAEAIETSVGVGYRFRGGR